MQKQAVEYGGLLSTLRDKFAMIQRLFGQPIMERLTLRLRELVSFISGPGFQAFGKLITLAGQVGAEFTSAFATATNLSLQFTKSLTGIDGNALFGGIESGLTRVRDLLRGLADNPRLMANLFRGGFELIAAYGELAFVKVSRFAKIEFARIMGMLQEFLRQMAGVFDVLKVTLTTMLQTAASAISFAMPLEAMMIRKAIESIAAWASRTSPATTMQ